MRFGWLVPALGFALGCPLVGCSSGQTGSPDCVGPASCLCDPLYGGGTLLRVHVERVEAGKLEAVVDEVFSTVYGASQASVGDRVGGSLLAEQPCARDAASTVHVGSDLFVLYSLGYRGEGGASLLDGVFSWAVPWADTLSFGASTELSASELSVLASPDSCLQRFPPAPAPPCHDTQMVGACSAAPKSKSSSVGYGALLLGLAAWVRCVRRRRDP